MLAATCFSTFNVCPEHISATLVNEEDFSIAMECAVIVNVNTPSSLSGDDLLYLNRMLSRHRRLLHSLEPLFSQSLPTSRGRARLLHAGTYDRALTRLMPGYRQGSSSSWHVLHKQNSRWICCVTGSGQEVHYDLLTGKLLIGGKSSGRLPQEMVEHSTYKSIFGDVSVQISSLRTIPEVLSETFRCSSLRHGRNGVYDLVYHVWISGKTLLLFSVLY